MTRIRITAERAARMQSALEVEAMTFEELMVVSGLSLVSVHAWVKTMRRMRRVRIGGWAPDKRGRIFVMKFEWVTTDAKDVPRPGPARTPAERMLALRKRRKDEQS